MLNKDKFERHGWWKKCTQNAVKGGYIDGEDAIKRFYSGQNRYPRMHGGEKPKRFRADNGVDTVKMVKDRLKLPKLAGGNVKCHEGTPNEQ